MRGMTRDVLGSDVDYARRLIDADCTDSSIVAALVWRGVDSAKAAQLVETLRCGRRWKCSPASIPGRRTSPHSTAHRKKARKLSTDVRSSLLIVLVLSLILYWVCDLLVDLPPQSQSISINAPFIQTGKFEKAAQAFTNTVSH